MQPDYAFGRGDAEAALAAAQHRLEGQLAIGGQEHFYLEGQVALAIPGEEGQLTIVSSTQDPAEVQHIAARVLGIPDAMVMVETRRMGGAFGGKESQACVWAAIAALGARITGRPCKLRLDRDEDFAATGKRHDFRADWRIGFDDAGRLAAYDVMLNARCGCSMDLSQGVVDRAMFHAANAYWMPAVHVASRRLKTNTVSNTAFRGFGGPQGILAIERAMDAVAHATGRDPLDVRKANLYASGRDVTPYGLRVDGEARGHGGGAGGLVRLSRAPGRDRGVQRGQRHPAQGLALTPVTFGISFTLPHMNQAGALVNVYQDGSILLNHGGTEMGQGLRQGRPGGGGGARRAAGDGAAERHEHGDRAQRLADRSLRGLRPQRHGGPDRRARDQGSHDGVRRRAVGRGPEEIVFRDGRVLAGNKSMRFGELAQLCRRGRVQLSATGFYRTPDLDWNREKRTGRPFYYFAYGAACSEVAIDTLTGEMKVERVDILHDVGRSLNPAIDIGQIEGGFVQGMGWLTTEELVFDGDGRLATHAPSTYKIPVASDVPEKFNVRLAAGANPVPTIYRSKGVGEPPLILAISVFSAILDALHSLRPGRQVPLDAPATPERILMAAQAMRA